MKRTINFRGYNLKNKRWLYGYYFVNRGKHYIVQYETVNPFAEAEDFEVDEESIGQYVGSYEGNDIYEGDVVEVTERCRESKHYVGVVVYCYYACKFRIECGSLNFPITGSLQRTETGLEYYFQYRVVGNEYEKNKCVSIKELQKKWFDSMREMELEAALLGIKNKDISNP